MPKKEGISTVACNVPLVGIRLPSNTIAQAFLKTVGLPIVAPSANISGKPSPTNASMVYDNLGENVPMIIDGGESEAGIESTVVQVITTPLTKGGAEWDEAGGLVQITPSGSSSHLPLSGENSGKFPISSPVRGRGRSEATEEGVIKQKIPPTSPSKGGFKILILRPGFVTKDDLEQCFGGEIEVEYSQTNPELSPGMRYKHYSITGEVNIISGVNETLLKKEKKI